jgi:hypothetical protein
MPIPLGIFATAGASAASLGSYELISTAYGTGSSGTVTFSSIDQTYKHLQIRAVHATTSGAGGVETYLRLNGVTSSSYSQHLLLGNGSSVSASGYGPESQIPIGYSAGYISGAHSGTIIDILDYASTAKNKTLRILSGQNTGVTRIQLRSGALYSTSAVTSLSIYFGDNFTSTSRFSLYGIKG